MAEVPVVLNRARTFRMQLGKTHYVFDRTGRLVWASQLHQVVRRGLDNRLLEVTLQEGAPAGTRSYRDLSETEKWHWLTQVYDLVKSVNPATLTRSQQTAVRQIQRWTADDLRADESLFNSVYQPVTILPPDQYHALVVQLTEGCSYNHCTFCDFYHNRSFHVKSDAQLRTHLKNIRTFFGKRISDRTNVFLGDGNALVAPTKTLLGALSLLRGQIGDPLASSVATFMDVFSLVRKSDEDLRALRAAHLDTLYMGLESGLDSLRTWLQKPGTARDALAAMNRCKEAGFRLGVIVLVGVAGPEVADQHLSATVSILQQVAFTQGDVIYLSPFVEPQNPGYRSAQATFSRQYFTPNEMFAEMNRWKDQLQGRTQAKLTSYRIEEHMY